MNIQDQIRFDSLYQRYLNELTLQGKSPKTINMYSRCLRQIGDFFDCCPDQLTSEQLKTYFLDLVNRRSWSMVKVARNAIQFFYKHVLCRPWQWINIVKPPKVQPLQDVLTQDEVCRIINQTHKLSYQVFYLTAYSILRLKLPEQTIQKKKTEELCPCCGHPMTVIPFIKARPRAKLRTIS